MQSERRASEPSELSCSPIPSIIQLFSPKFQNPSFPTRAFPHSRLVISRPFKVFRFSLFPSAPPFPLSIFCDFFLPKKYFLCSVYAHELNLLAQTPCGFSNSIHFTHISHVKVLNSLKKMYTCSLRKVAPF